MKHSLYKPPFGKKRIRKNIYKPYKNCNGKVKVYTQEEIDEYVRKEEAMENKESKYFVIMRADLSSVLGDKEWFLFSSFEIADKSAEYYGGIAVPEVVAKQILSTKIDKRFLVQAHEAIRVLMEQRINSQRNTEDTEDANKWDWAMSLARNVLSEFRPHEVDSVNTEQGE